MCNENLVTSDDAICFIVVAYHLPRELSMRCCDVSYVCGMDFWYLNYKKEEILYARQTKISKIGGNLFLNITADTWIYAR
jgi:hypothetical protein